MYGFDFSNFHSGHNRILSVHGNRTFIVCLDCGVAGELESISAKVPVAEVC